MSSYVYFFVRKHDEFAPIGIYGRGTQVYQLFNARAPWEQIAPVTYGMLNAIKNELRTLQDSGAADIEKARRKIELIPSFANSIEDKMDAIAEEESWLEELNETAKERDVAAAFVSFLFDILDAAEYGNDETLKSDEYVYFGVECGSAVSAQDLAK